MAKIRFRVYYMRSAADGGVAYSLDVEMNDKPEPEARVSDWQDAVALVAAVVPKDRFPDAPNTATADDWAIRSEMGSAHGFATDKNYDGKKFDDKDARVNSSPPPTNPSQVPDIVTASAFGSEYQSIRSYDSYREFYPNSRQKVKAGNGPKD